MMMGANFITSAKGSTNGFHQHQEWLQELSLYALTETRSAIAHMKRVDIQNTRTCPRTPAEQPFVDTIKMDYMKTTCTITLKQYEDICNGIKRIT
jgi:hypothetical protein